jgi:hypothetical protein
LFGRAHLAFGVCDSIDKENILAWFADAEFDSHTSKPSWVYSETLRKVLYNQEGVEN